MVFASTIPAPPVGFFQVRTALVEIAASIAATSVLGGSGAVPIAMGSELTEKLLVPRAFTACTRNM